MEVPDVENFYLLFTNIWIGRLPVQYFDVALHVNRKAVTVVNKCRYHLFKKRFFLDLKPFLGNLTYPKLTKSDLIQPYLI